MIFHFDREINNQQGNAPASPSGLLGTFSLEYSVRLSCAFSLTLVPHERHIRKTRHAAAHDVVADVAVARRGVASPTAAAVPAAVDAQCVGVRIRRRPAAAADDDVDRRRSTAAAAAPTTALAAAAAGCWRSTHCALMNDIDPRACVRSDTDKTDDPTTDAAAMGGDVRAAGERCAHRVVAGARLDDLCLRRQRSRMPARDWFRDYCNA
jgi:hypothetical protein